MRPKNRIGFAVLLGFLSSLAISSGDPSQAFAGLKPVARDMSEVFHMLPDHPPGTPALAETTVKHVVFLDSMEQRVGTPGAGWGAIDFRQGHPNAWNIVSGGHSCVGNAWWCGQPGFQFGDGYDNNWIQLLTTNVPITLGNNNYTLTFKYRCQIEYGYDWVWVMLKGGNVGAKWDTLWSYGGNFGPACNSATLSIPDSFTTVVQPITLRFAFASDLTVSTADSSGVFTGFSVDDVKIAAGNNTPFFDTMDPPSSWWTTSSPDPGSLWHLENGPIPSLPASCKFLSTNVWVPFNGTGFVPDFVDAMLTTPPMDIQGVFSPNASATELWLQFADWINLPPENANYWSLWIQGSDDKVTWTPWHNALGLIITGGNPQCVNKAERSFNPYDTDTYKTGIQPGTRYIRLGFRLRDQKLTGFDPEPLRIGYQTDGIWFDEILVYSKYTITGVETVDASPAGSKAAIRKVFPNPFNPSTKVEFSVPKTGPVSVRIFDLQGRRVATLVDQSMAPGIYRVPWNGKGEQGQALASGVYFAQIQSGASRQSVRLTMLR